MRGTLMILDALENFLDSVEQMDLGPLGAFTCGEANALAILMREARGEETATWVILHHVVDGDEEEDELRDHLAIWPQLGDLLKEHVAEDTSVMRMLAEIEKGITDDI